MRTPSILLATLLAVAPAGEQEKGDPPDRRQAGAVDLDAWSRQGFGAAGSSTNPDTSSWLPWRPRPGDVDPDVPLGGLR